MPVNIACISFVLDEQPYYIAELRDQLELLKNQVNFSISYRRVEINEPTNVSAKDVERSNIVLLLISSRFLSQTSYLRNSYEINEIFRRREIKKWSQGKCRLILIKLDDSSFKGTLFDDMSSYPGDEGTVSKLAIKQGQGNREAGFNPAYNYLVKEIYQDIVAVSKKIEDENQNLKSSTFPWKTAIPIFALLLGLSFISGLLIASLPTFFGRGKQPIPLPTPSPEQTSTTTQTPSPMPTPTSNTTPFPTPIPTINSRQSPVPYCDYPNNCENRRIRGRW